MGNGKWRCGYFCYKLVPTSLIRRYFNIVIILYHEINLTNHFILDFLMVTFSGSICLISAPFWLIWAILDFIWVYKRSFFSLLCFSLLSSISSFNLEITSSLSKLFLSLSHSSKFCFSSRVFSNNYFSLSFFCFSSSNFAIYSPAFFSLSSI